MYDCLNVLCSNDEEKRTEGGGSRGGGEEGREGRVRILIDSGKNVMDEGSAAAAARPQESKNKR